MRKTKQTLKLIINQCEGLESPVFLIKTPGVVSELKIRGVELWPVTKLKNQYRDSFKAATESLKKVKYDNKPLPDHFYKGKVFPVSLALRAVLTLALTQPVTLVTDDLSLMNQLEEFFWHDLKSLKEHFFWPEWNIGAVTIPKLNQKYLVDSLHAA